MTNREVISIMVENQSNVLTRIASLYGRRGYNIDSLTVSTTNDPATSRITIVFDGNEQILNQIILQTKKLEVVKSVTILSPEDSIYRELLLLKVDCNKDNRSNLVEIVNIYRGKIISLTKDYMIIELTGAPNKIDGFIEMINCYSIQDVCRTGITGISRNENI
jgi:acetolactate synthase-1/3 small subunit